MLHHCFSVKTQLPGVILCPTHAVGRVACKTSEQPRLCGRIHFCSCCGGTNFSAVHMPAVVHARKRDYSRTCLSCHSWACQSKLNAGKRATILLFRQTLMNLHQRFRVYRALSVTFGNSGAGNQPPILSANAPNRPPWGIES